MSKISEIFFSKPQEARCKTCGSIIYVNRKKSGKASEFCERCENINEAHIEDAERMALID